MVKEEKTNVEEEQLKENDVPQENVENVVLDEQEVKKLLEGIQEKQKAFEELSERYKRLQADFDNFRRRTNKEKEEISGFVAEGMLLKVLPILDNFERAMATNEGTDLTTFKTGVEMIHKQLLQAYEQIGLKPMESVGEIFDPQKHEAVMRVDDNEKPDGLVVEEFQRGYMLNTKVIRPSMVKVVTNN